jgi:hypothetical protein
VNGQELNRLFGGEVCGHDFVGDASLAFRVCSGGRAPGHCDVHGGSLITIFFDLKTRTKGTLMLVVPAFAVCLCIHWVPWL